MGVLAANVALRNPDTGTVVVLVSGDEVPDWAVDLIDNPDILIDNPGVLCETGGEPPRTGKGSGRGAWADYAAEIGVDVAEGMTRDDIISAIEA